MAAGVMDSAAMVMIMRSTLGFGSDDGSGEWRMARASMAWRTERTSAARSRHAL